MTQHPLLTGDAVEPTLGRRPFDYYETPPWATRALLDVLPESLGVVFEPCVGDGAIARLLEPRVQRVITNDLDPARHADYHFDAGAVQWPVRPYEIDWVITNPPFSVAFEILRRALIDVGANVAMLLRLSFLEPTAQRGGLLASQPPHRLIVLPRHSFTGTGKTDSVTAAWMIWSSRVDSGIQVLASKGPHT